MTQQQVAAALNTVRGKLDWSTDPNLAFKIELVNDRLRAGLTSEDIRIFVKVRNEVAHQMQFKPSLGKPHVQYRAVRYVVDRFILGILRYNGAFIDCRSLQRTQHG